jgi:ATP-dependent DNA ligase
VPRFDRLQHQIGRRAAQRHSPVFPVALVVFDLLHLDGQPNLGLPWSGRRALLDDRHLVHAHCQRRYVAGSGSASNCSASTSQRPA